MHRARRGIQTALPAQSKSTGPLGKLGSIPWPKLKSRLATDAEPKQRRSAPTVLTRARLPCFRPFYHGRADRSRGLINRFSSSWVQWHWRHRPALSFKTVYDVGFRMSSRKARQTISRIRDPQHLGFKVSLCRVHGPLLRLRTRLARNLEHSTCINVSGNLEVHFHFDSSIHRDAFQGQVWIKMDTKPSWQPFLHTIWTCKGRCATASAIYNYVGI